MVRRPATVPPIKPPAVLPDTVPACHELIQQLLQDLDFLRERVNLNSRKSSKPPSSAGLGTPPRTPKAQSPKRQTPGWPAWALRQFSWILARAPTHEQSPVPTTTQVHGLRLRC